MSLLNKNLPSECVLDIEIVRKDHVSDIKIVVALVKMIYSICSDISDQKCLKTESVYKDINAKKRIRC